MSVKKIIFISESADASSTPAGALAACLSIIVLDINDNSVSEFRSQYRQFFDLAKNFASKNGFGSEFKSVSKRIMRGDDMFGDDDDVMELGKQIRRNRKSLYEDKAISKELFKLIIAGARNLIKDDKNAWDYLCKNISLLHNTRLTAAFVPDDDEPVKIDGLDPSSASKQMRQVYLKMTGEQPKYGYFVNPMLIPQYREKNPKLWEEYARLSKVLNRETKRLVFRYVRTKQKQHVSVDEINKFLDKQGLLHNMPRGFTGGLVDENMKFYTSTGNRLSKAPSGLVRMNPKYDPAQDNTYVLYVTGFGKTSKGGDQSNGRIRTETYNESNKKKRHAVAQQFLENENRIRAKWLKDLKRNGTKEQIMATMVELLWATSARIGGQGNKTAGETTYGLSTLVTDHVRIKGNKLLFDYIGKKKTPQPAVYMLSSQEAKLVGQIMAKLIADKEKDELVFTFRGRPVLRHSIGQYLKSLGTQMSAHSFRRVTGTRMALQILKNNPFINKAKKGEVKETEVNRWFKTEMTKIGEALHHRNGEKVTGMTAVKSYIDPTVIENFYDSLGLRVPSFVPIPKKDQ